MLHPAQLSLRYAVALQALSNLQPATQQVHVCKTDACGASPHLPPGTMASGSHSPLAEVGTRPQAAPAENGTICAEAAAADTMQPAAEQV